MQLSLESDWGVLFPPDSGAHSSETCHRMCTPHHNTHANYILIIKHSNKQTERKSPRNRRVLMEQVLAWCGWPDSPLLDQSPRRISAGWGGGQGDAPVSLAGTAILRGEGRRRSLAAERGVDDCWR